MINGRGNVNRKFDTENVPAQYEVVYGANDVTVRRIVPSADLNGDGFVDLLDFSLFEACFQGPDQPPSPICTEGVEADLDLDLDVDLDDFEMFYPALTGRLIRSLPIMGSPQLAAGAAMSAKLLFVSELTPFDPGP